MKIEVKELVCDWGIFINGELSKDLIFNSKANAEEVKRIIELDIENKRFDSVHQKVNITKGEDRMLNQFRKASFIDVGIDDYSGTVPQVLISNETRLVDAYLYPELVEVLDEKR